MHSNQNKTKFNETAKLKKFKQRLDKTVKKKRTPKHYDKRDENSLFGY